jgi:excisionase family DNA binding protein
MEKRYLGIKELAEYLGISIGTVYSWVCYKKIPYLKMGRLVKFDLRRIDQWTQEKSIEVME